MTRKYGASSIYRKKLAVKVARSPKKALEKDCTAARKPKKRDSGEQAAHPPSSFTRSALNLFLSYQSTRRLLALGVVGVHGLARALGAALCAGETGTTALGPLSSAASTGSRSSSRSGLGGESGGSGSSRGVVGRGSRGRARAGGSRTSLPEGRAGHGESLAAVVDAEVGIWVRGLVGTGEL